VLVLGVVGITALVLTFGPESPDVTVSENEPTDATEATDATGGADATQASTDTTDTSDGASSDEPSDAAPDPSGPTDASSNPSGLQGQLLTAGQSPLDGWSAADSSGLLPMDLGSNFFCGKSIALPADTASAMFTGPDGRILDQHVYRGTAAQATAAMKQLRASTSCTSWNEGAVGKATVSRGAPVDLGDEAVTYQVTTALAQTYQVFFRQGGDFCVITIATVGGPVTAADRDLAAKAAVTAARRLTSG
jgi:hypothetical protein